MNEMYCGKDCQVCADKEQTNCTGCAGQQKECSIAECCTGKGHESCGTCSFRENCRKLMGKENMPSYIRRQREFQKKRLDEAAARAEQAARRAPLMAKWLRVMFWLVIAAGVMELIWEPLGVVCSLAYVWALLQLKDEDSGYRTAAVCKAVAALVSLVIVLISGGGEAPNWTLVLSLPAAVVRAVGTYSEYMAHSCIVGYVDTELSVRWEKLWKWMVLSVATMLGSAVVGLLIPALGLLGIFAAAIAALVVCVMEMVALYRSAEAFKRQAASFAAGNVR